MMRAACLGLCLAIASCAPLPRGASRPPSDADVALIAEAEAEWSRLGGGVGGAWERVVVVDADEETMRNGTGYCATRGPVCGLFDTRGPELTAALQEAGCLDCVVGATRLRPDAPWPAGLAHQRVELYLSTYIDPWRRCRALAHEALHGLGWSIGEPDHYHERAGVWGTSTSSAEGRLRALCGY